MTVLTVDLGTSNTVAVLAVQGQPPRVVEVDGATMMPSAIFAAEGGTLVVGKEAERRARTDPARYEPNPKRRVDEGTLLLGDVVVPVTDAFGAVLRRIADEVKRQLGGAVPDEVRLTHPAQWGPVRRNVLLSAARQAGLGQNLVLVPEPVAAAAHFASFQGLAQGQALAVYDLGAGTFDVAVVGATQQGFVVLAEAGLADLGGLDVDQALLDHIGRQVSAREPGRWQRVLRPESTVDRRAQRALREDVKAGKEALSTHPQTEIALPEPFEDVLVTRAELEELITAGLLRSVELMASTVRSAGLSPDRLAGIYLVGGSSRIPLVATLIAQHLGVVPINLDQPESAVARGALHASKDGVSLRTGAVAPSRPVPQPVMRQVSQPIPVPQPPLAQQNLPMQQQVFGQPLPGSQPVLLQQPPLAQQPMPMPMAQPIPQQFVQQPFQGPVPPQNVNGWQQPNTQPTAIVVLACVAAALSLGTTYWPPVLAGVAMVVGATQLSRGKGSAWVLAGSAFIPAFIAFLSAAPLWGMSFAWHTYQVVQVPMPYLFLRWRWLVLMVAGVLALVVLVLTIVWRARRPRT